jgi:hypothetical protein
MSIYIPLEREGCSHNFGLRYVLEDTIEERGLAKILNIGISQVSQKFLLNVVDIRSG